MTDIVFDAGPVITLTMNNMLWLLHSLKKYFKGNFYIPESIKYELIDRPIEGKKFKFEALHTLSYLKRNILKVYRHHIRKETNDLAHIINNVFHARGRAITIVHLGEVEALAVALKLKDAVIAIDERTLRLLVEDPLMLHKILQKKMKTKISINKKMLNKLRQLTKNIKVIRSVDIATRAFELGMFDKYLPHDMTEPKKELLTAILWGLKLDGCTISPEEIDTVVSIEGL